MCFQEVCWVWLLLIASSYSAYLEISTNGTASDLICLNASPSDECVINCIHPQGAKGYTIDCQDALVCILNITATECASTTTVHAENVIDFQIYALESSTLPYSNIYLPSNNNGSAYIAADFGVEHFTETNFYGNKTKNITLHCYDTEDPNRNTHNKDCNSFKLHALNSYNLAVYVDRYSTMSFSTIYCPEHGSCIVQAINTGSSFVENIIYSFKGIDITNTFGNGLQFSCNDGAANSCRDTIIRCDILYTTYSIMNHVNSQWLYGECANTSRIIDGNYESNYYYVFSDIPDGSLASCPPNILTQGLQRCIINCVNHGVSRKMHCSDGECIINILNGCGSKGTVYIHNASKIKINLLEEGSLWTGRILTDSNAVAIDQYLEINVFDGSRLDLSSIYCPMASSVSPSCVVNCESGADCTSINYYSINGIPNDLQVVCNEFIDVALGCKGDMIYCGEFENITASIEFDTDTMQWIYGQCFGSIVNPSTTTATTSTTIQITEQDNATTTNLETTTKILTTSLYTTSTSSTYMDFEYKFDFVSRETFVNINKSVDAIEIIINDLYDNNTDIKYQDIDIINKDNLVYNINNNTVIVIVRIKYIEIYEYFIINYTRSRQYGDQFEDEIKQKFNETIIVTITRYVDITSTATAPIPTDEGFSVDYSDTLFMIILIINGIAIFLAFIAFILTKICKYKTDSAKPFILVIFGVRFTDIITDLNVCYVLWSDYLQNNDDDNILLLVLCILSLIFLLIPWFINIYSISIIRKRMANNRRTSLWFSRYNNSTFFLILVVLTGDVFFALQLISSYLFGITRLDAGISEKLDIDQFRIIKVFGVVCLENIPQLIIAAIYAFNIEKNNDEVFSIAMLSIITSIISIFICITSWCLMKISQKQQSYQMIKYSIAINLNATSLNMENEKKQILKNIGYKHKLRNNLSLTIGAEKEQIEIVYTSITEKGCYIDIVHFVHNTELQINTNNDIEGYIHSKYHGNEQYSNQVLQKHYGLSYGVTHKIIFAESNQSKESNETETNTTKQSEMVQIIDNAKTNDDANNIETLEEEENESMIEDDDDAKLEEVMNTPQ